MSRILDGLEGVVWLIDDELMFRKSQEEHDARLLAVFQGIKVANVTQNATKCEFNK